MDSTPAGGRPAFGHPGIEPRWSRGAKDGVGTAYSTASKVWFTLWNGIVTEAYYPTVDRPQIRDLEYLVTDGKSFFHEEKRDMLTEIERLSEDVLGYRIVNRAPDERYSITKTIITDPHLPCILQRTKLSVLEGFEPHLYALCAPRLDGAGWGNNARIIDVSGRTILTAERNGLWLALGATIPFSKASCGFVGRSDGWTDLATDFRMDWDFDEALDGNVALTGELDLSAGREFTLGLAFGDGLRNAISTLLQSLATPFPRQRARFVAQWRRPVRKLLPLEKAAGDDGHLYRGSFMALLSHEDKTYPGALIASLSIPWGEAKGDEDRGGYHLVWTRDMVNSATGLLAAGDTETPLRALVYLAASQQADGGFPQNFWINGDRYWQGVQLDEVAFPILLARRMHREAGLQDFDPYPMVMRAASFLVQNGPATQQERWEEAGGYSPSTLASNIAALISAACFARERGEEATAKFLTDYADFLECHLEMWTTTSRGTLVDGIERHYIRINPASPHDPYPDENPDGKILAVANRPPGSEWSFPATEIVDGGFLELVRYGIRSSDDPLMIDSIRVIDHVLKVDTPMGPGWHRYNHDGYGQRADGGAYIGWGQGRAWPLLTGERGHYELAAGGDIGPYIRALEGFSSNTGLLPEQVWDEPDRPEAYLFLGEPTGAAMPLMWAHAEYIKLLRSAFDGQVFDLVPEAKERYCGRRSDCKLLEIWKPNRRVSSVIAGFTLRVQAPVRFVIKWTADEWVSSTESEATMTSLGIGYVDVAAPRDTRAPLRFEFVWSESAALAGAEHMVRILPHNSIKNG